MRSKPNFPMKRLLAKLPRSSRGSRDASASSRAAAFPADILEVSMTGAAFAFSFTPVSALNCSGGAYSGVFFWRLGFQADLAGGLPTRGKCGWQRLAGWKPASQGRQDAHLPQPQLQSA